MIRPRFWRVCFRSFGVVVLSSLLATGLVWPARAADLTPDALEADFDVLWTSVNRSYAYFDIKATDWGTVRTLYRPQIREVKSRDQLVGLLERILEELYDSHAHLNTNTASSPRLVPSGADLWAEWRGPSAVVLEVRPGTPAAKVGIRAGMELVSFNGTPIGTLVDARLGRCLKGPDPAARDWALRAILAGRHDEVRTIGVRSPSGVRVVTLDDREGNALARNQAALLDHRRLPAEIGYIRIVDSLGQIETITAFDAALDALKDTRGMILDLRDTPSGGISTVARGLMGRLIEREAPYQKHVLTEEERETGIRRSWVEIVSPRGPFTYRAPLVVLVNHWTGSMGEGMTIGLDGMRRGRVVGTPMAGLLGAKISETLPNSKIQVSFPAEQLFHVNGTPRERFRPQVEVDLARAAQDVADPVLEAGRGELERMLR